MESTFAELIRNLNQTIDQLTKENAKLRDSLMCAQKNSSNLNINNENEWPKKILYCKSDNHCANCKMYSSMCSNDDTCASRCINNDYCYKKNLNLGQIMQKNSVSSLKEQEKQIFENACYIISKSLDLMFLIKKDISNLLDNMQSCYNIPSKILDLILDFINRNRNIFCYDECNKEELINKIKNEIYQKLKKC